MPRHIYSLAIIFLMLLLVLEIYAFGRPRSHKHNRKSAEAKKDCNSSGSKINDKSEEEKPPEVTTIDYDPYYNCGLIGSGIVQKIPYQSVTSGFGPTVVNLSSACVRCGICLAIAERINETLLEAHDAMRTNRWLEDDEAELCLRTICDNEFRHYTLREIDGERYIGDNLPGAILVASTADGQWEIALRKKCHEILDEVGTRELYKYWREWCDGATNELVNILCRSESGGLRDCRSIEGDPKKPELCPNFYRAGIKVIAELN